MCVINHPVISYLDGVFYYQFLNAYQNLSDYRFYHLQCS
ncbi:hypothetical protein BN135_502 [Cronobacter muytjensii 530]|nr:hypothetical protein BN133_1139 [Cronobacter dublinensis 582]